MGNSMSNQKRSALDIATVTGRTPTDEQIKIIESALEPAVVIAGAGSGKTETMAARVLWLVANGHAKPEEILGLTFTRKAASELKKRIKDRLKQLRKAGLIEKNLSSKFLRIIDRAYEAFDYQANEQHLHREAQPWQ